MDKEYGKWGASYEFGKTMENLHREMTGSNTPVKEHIITEAPTNKMISLNDVVCLDVFKDYTI